VHRVFVGAALRILRYAQISAALVIVSASEVMPIVSAHMKFGSLLQIKLHSPACACVCVRLEHRGDVRINAGGLPISNTRILRLSGSRKAQTDQGRTTSNKHRSEKGGELAQCTKQKLIAKRA